MNRIILVIIAATLLPAFTAYGQGGEPPAGGAANLSPKLFERIGSRATAMERMITRGTRGYLDRMEKAEASLEKTLYGRDPVAAKNLFAGSQQKYHFLMASLLSPAGSGSIPPLKEYLPLVDSIHTALRFLGEQSAAMPGLSLSTLDAIRGAGNQLQQLEGKWQQARDIESFIRQREQQLSQQLTGYGLGRNLLSINRSAFYFQQQLLEYKSLLQDKDRIQEKVLNGLRNSTAFQHFMQKNSYVGRMFSLPYNYGSTASLSGLQTKEMIQQRIGLSPPPGQTGGGGADPSHYMQQKVDAGRQQISQLKDKLRTLGNYSGGGDIVMPQFKPNDQKVKTFLNRLVYNISLQTQQSYGFMPATADLGLTVGYKLSSKATIGAGGSYNVGLGQGLSHLSYSGQGAGIRSYVDLRARGNLWLTGGFEYNYVQGLSSWRDLGHWDQWQKSALFGLSKKFKLAASKSSNIQLLFDALYKQHIPPSPPLLFRVGYSFN